MLQKLSNGAKGGFSKFILVGALFMAVAGLVMTDVGGFFRDGVSSTSVAKVGRQGIPYHEFDRFLRNTLSRRGLSLQDAYQTGQVNDILNRYVQDILFVQAAHDLGLRVSDAKVAAQLHKFVEPLLDGQKTAQQALDQILAQQGLREEDFISAIRRDMTSSTLQSALLGGINTAPKLLATELLRYQAETRDITYLNLTDKSVKLDSDPSEEELQEFYALTKAEYRIPERRTLTIAIINPNDLLEDISVSDADAQTYYDQNKNRYEIPAGLRFEQAIFPSEDAAKAFIADIDTPDTFKEAAAINYRAAQTYQKENLPPVLAEVAFEDNGTPLRGPVESPLGWHVIHVLGHADITYTPFESVKGTIIATLKTEKENEMRFGIIERVNNDIDDGAGLTALAKTYKMEIRDIGPMDQFGLNEKSETALKSFEKDAADILDISFNLYADEISEILELSTGNYALLKLNHLTEASFPAFDDVRGKITERLIDSLRHAKNQDRVQRELALLQRGEVTLPDLAKQYGRKLGTLKSVPRSEITQQSQDLPANVINELFDTMGGAAISGVTEDGFVLATSDNIHLDKVTTPLSEEDQNAFMQLNALLVLSNYYDQLRAETKIVINQSLLNQLYGAPQTSN